MTYGDKIRAMSDDQLAGFLAAILHENRVNVIKQLQDKGIALGVNVVDMPMVSKAAHLKWLREPVMEDNL